MPFFQTRNLLQLGIKPTTQSGLTKDKAWGKMEQQEDVEVLFTPYQTVTHTNWVILVWVQTYTPILLLPPTPAPPPPPATHPTQFDSSRSRMSSLFHWGIVFPIPDRGLGKLGNDPRLSLVWVQTYAPIPSLPTPMECESPTLKLSRKAYSTKVLFASYQTGT